MYTAHLPVLLCTCCVLGPDTASKTFVWAKSSTGSHASDIPLMQTRRGPPCIPRGTAPSHLSNVVQAGVTTGKWRFNCRSNASPTKASGRSPVADVACPCLRESHRPAGRRAVPPRRATGWPRRTSSEETESPGRVIPLIQNILIRSLSKTFLGEENYLIKYCRHYLRPEAWLTFIILIPREVYFTLGFVLLLIEVGLSKQKRKHV